MSRDLSPVLPSAIAVVFGVVVCDGTPGPATWTATIPLATVPGFASYAGSPGARTFHDTATAYFATGSSPAPTNQPTLNALALQVAVDTCGWRSGRSFDVCYNGALAWDVDGFTDTVTWCYAATDATTRVMSGPYNGAPEELAHDTGDSCASLGIGGSSSSGDGNPGKGFTGTVTVQSDLICDGLHNQVYLMTETYSQGVLVAVGTPYLAHGAGCCSCADTSSSSPSSAGP